MKKILYIVLVIIICLTLVGCEINPNQIHDINNLPNSIRAIENQRNLYYDINTQIVYILFKESPNASYRGYGYMSAYYAPNGLPYIYDVKNQELIEINY